MAACGFPGNPVMHLGPMCFKRKLAEASRGLRHQKALPKLKPCARGFSQRRWKDTLLTFLDVSLLTSSLRQILKDASLSSKIRFLQWQTLNEGVKKDGKRLWLTGMFLDSCFATGLPKVMGICPTAVAKGCSNGEAKDLYEQAFRDCPDCSYAATSSASWYPISEVQGLGSSQTHQ